MIKIEHEKLSPEEEKKSFLLELETLTEKIKKDEFEGLVVICNHKNKGIQQRSVVGNIDDMLQIIGFVNENLKKALLKKGFKW